ncbi:MAG: sugar phosphate isomerase/epimerase [Oscillospiraceae bacterium]|nr:sugar phosphate isomerase/epimerase [Oscillospiraceae bacterium]
MKIGISTASLYPLHTEDAILEVAKLGVSDTEIFLNSVSELSGEVFAVIQGLVRDYRLNIMSLHPFTSPLETLFLFSSYDRRFAELSDLYKRHFDMMNKINAGIFVVHGAYKDSKCPDEMYVERFRDLVLIGKSMGITVAQENVCYCKSGKLEFLEMLSRELGDDAHFVLDIKQVLRYGGEVFQYVKSLGKKIVHLHLSDSDETRDCLPIGDGNFDFAGLFRELRAVGYNGGAVVELYRDNYAEYSRLAESVEKLREISKNA